MKKLPAWLIFGLTGVLMAAVVTRAFTTLGLVQRTNVPVIYLTALLAVFTVILACGTIYLGSETRTLARETKRSLDAADIHHQELLSPMLKLNTPKVEIVDIAGKAFYR